MEKEIENRINTLTKEIEHYEKENLEVSTANIGWHIEHSLLVINSIIKGLERANPISFKAKFSIPKMFVKVFNKLPKGRKAPSKMLPTVILNKTQLQEHVSNTLATLPKLKSFHANAFIVHPVFGALNLKDAIWFMRIHTDHHIKIIKEIVG